MIRVPLHLLMLLLPLAVAGHNIGTGVAGLMLFAILYFRRRQLAPSELWATQKVPLITSVLFIALVFVSGLLNAAMPDAEGGRFVAGYLIWCLLPPILFLSQPPISERESAWLLRTFAFVVAVMGGVAIAQANHGFKLVGSSFVAASTRAQGFYSHPLTFAYVGLVLLPLGAVWASRLPRRPGGWIALVGSSAIVYASQSRMAQAVGVVIVVGNLLVGLRGKMRTLALSSFLVLGVVLATTDNPVKYRFSRTLAGIDVRSGYSGDDRVAFWHAHWLMLKERPILGHGDNTNTAYRKPYYAAIGLEKFERQYEAHNAYLQIAVNGGVLALTVFLAWFAWNLAIAASIAKASLPGFAILQSLLALSIGALTQNAFQDSEVRFALTLLVAALWLVYRQVEPKAVLRTASSVS